MVRAATDRPHQRLPALIPAPPSARRLGRSLAAALGVLLVAALLAAFSESLTWWRGEPATTYPGPSPAGASGSAPASTGAPGEPATVRHVTDGDTFVARRDRDGVELTVRLLSVDAPETVAPGRPVACGGPEAAAWLRARLPVGERVQLQYDVARRDRYGRDLAWVVTSDGRAVNLDLVEAGLAVAVRVEPNHAHHDEVLAAQRRARDAGRGPRCGAAHAATLLPDGRGFLS